MPVNFLFIASFQMYALFSIQYRAIYSKPRVVPIVTQSHSTGLHDRPIENSTHELGGQTVFSFQKMFKITKLVPQCLMLPIEHYC